MKLLKMLTPPHQSNSYRIDYLCSIGYVAAFSR